MSGLTVCIEDSIGHIHCDTHCQAFTNPADAWKFIVSKAKSAITCGHLWSHLLDDAIDNGLDEYSMAFDDGREVYQVMDDADQEECKKHAEALLNDHNIVFWLVDFNRGFDVQLKKTLLSLRKLAVMVEQEVKLDPVYDEIFYAAA